MARNAMWLVRTALSRPYTFIVLALVLLIFGTLAILRTPTDVFPNIDIPVISVVWTYTGMPPDDMANRITSIFERAVTTTVNNIEHIESESIIGMAVIKLFFHPNTSVSLAMSEVTAISQTLLKVLPPGTLPPLILNYNASTVPVMQLALSSETLPEQIINDLGNNFIRTQLATIQGIAIPTPYGGKTRQVLVDLNPKAMQANNISAHDISQAINQQSLILPAGTQKIGPYEYLVKLNSNPMTVDEFNHLPIKFTPNRILYIGDVAHVRDGFAPQTNIVRVNGNRAVLMSLLKTGSASTLHIVHRVKELLPLIKDTLPSSLTLSLLNDQSLFVTAAIKSVILEAVLAAMLTGLMILLFLGSLNSTLIITLSIPLSILTSLALLSMVGETINIMTLGGLALAVGILVDDATVTIENINWNLGLGKPIREAILDGAHQIAIPAFVSTLSICIVFFPMFFLGGVAQHLFVPMAEAVIFAMLASYFLSRTLVPTLCLYLLKTPTKAVESLPSPTSLFMTCHRQFEQQFQRFQSHYYTLLSWVLNNTSRFILYFLLFVLSSLLLLWPWLGSNFFPTVDAGQIKLHVQAKAGTRVEETARLVAQIDDVIRTVIRKNDLNTIVDNIGLPVSGINLSYSNSATVGPEDADILISLNKDHQPTEHYIRQLRRTLTQQFPGGTFAFLPADIVNQILNFGLPSPINIQIMGFKTRENRQYAYTLIKKIKQIPGVVDTRTRQAFHYPELRVNVDRSLAKELGLSQLNIASDLLITLSGSFQTRPNFWVNPQNNVSYPIMVQAPQSLMDSLQALRNIPLSTPFANETAPILGALTQITPGSSPSVISHFNVQPVIDIFAAVQDRDLGSVSSDIQALVNETKSKLPKGSQVVIKGQMITQQKAFKGLYLGLAFSILLIYLLIVVNFQSWIDPFIVVAALPAALAGIAWILFITHTTLSVPALTGAIMCMGVATANSILVISFARTHLAQGHDPQTCALEAGVTRLRPVLMTALAMILGMTPMAIGLGEGAEQNAPLGRAVIGGLSFATIATLLFVPALFSKLHRHRQRPS